jgi:O-antigen ligase
MPNAHPKSMLNPGFVNARNAGLALLFAVVIMWQIPHVLFGRYTILIILGALFWPAGWRALRAGPEGRLPFLAFAAFIAWLLLVALFISPEPLASLKELRAEWLPTALILLLGFGAGIVHGALAARVVFWALVAHAVLHLGSAAGLFLENGTAALRDYGGISDHRANVTYTTTLALAMLLADVAGSVRGAGGFGLRRRTQLAVFVLLLASTLVSATRNGLVVFLIVTVAGGIVIAVRYRGEASRRWWAIAGACLAFTVAGIAVGLKADARWSGFLETAPVAWDTAHHPQWLKGERNYTDLPNTALGKPVEPSAYYRIAYLKEGMALLVEHPLGTEIGRDTFEKLVRAKYGTAGMSHAHNGLIDLGLSTGFPGMALWLGVLGAFASLGWHAWRDAREPLGLALFLCVLGFGVRMLVDSTLRDHVIEEFALVAALLAGAIAAGARKRA